MDKIGELDKTYGLDNFMILWLCLFHHLKKMILKLKFYIFEKTEKLIIFQKLLFSASTKKLKTIFFWESKYFEKFIQTYKN